MISNDILKKKVLNSAIHGNLIKNNSELKPIDVISISENIPFEIPSNWKWVKVSSVVNMVSGGTPSRNEKSYWENGTIPFVKIGDMSKKYIDSTQEFITEKGLENSSAKMFEKGTILYSIFASIGVTSILNIRACTNQAILGVTPKSESIINNGYLYYILMGISDYLKSLGKGTSQMNINQKVLKDSLIPLPPIEEQIAISNKVDELFDLIDKKEKNDIKKEKLKSVLKEKILDSAIHGTLIENDNSLQAIEIEKELSDVPFDIPSNWIWSRMKNVVSINPRNKTNDETDVSFLPMTNIDGGFVSHYNCETRKWKEVKAGFTHFANNDVIIAKITPCFENRKSAYMKDLTNGLGAGTTELHVLRDEKGIMYMPYLLWYSKTNYFINSGKRKFTGTAGQQRISKNWLDDFVVSVPPLEEQKRIVEKIESLFELIEQL